MNVPLSIAMDPTFEEIEVAFPTADVSALSFTYSGHTLTAAFADWRGTFSTVVFRHVLAYKWDESSFERIDAKPDRVYRVRDSEWLSYWPQAAGLNHFVLGFLGLHPVGSGYLEVIAQTMEHHTS